MSQEASEEKWDWTPTHACYIGYEPLIRFLFQEGEHVESKDNDGNTPLMICVIKESTDMVRYLLTKGADVNAVNNDGDTALILAQTTEVTQILLNQSCININHVNSKGQTALSAAIETRNLGKSTLLIQHGAQKENQSNLLCYFLKCIQDKHTPVSSEDIMFVKFLCESGQDINKCNNLQESPLNFVINLRNYDLAEVLCQHGAMITHDILISVVRTNNIQMIPLLANYGAEMNKLKEDGTYQYLESALDVALSSSNCDCARELLYHGAYINVSYAVTKAVNDSNHDTLEFLINQCNEESCSVIQKDSSLICKAVEFGDLTIINILLHAGADINGIHDNHTPLMCALSTDVMKYLIQNGADVNFKTYTTPLTNLFSVKFFQKFKTSFLKSASIKETIHDLAGFLIKQGVSLKETDENGNTALMKSLRGYFPLNTMKLLATDNSVVNQRNFSGKTALHLTKDTEAVQFLLSLGADVNIQDKKGCTPLHHAIGFPSVMELLLENGAEVNKQDFLGKTPLLKLAKTLAMKVSDMVSSNNCDINQSSNLSELILELTNMARRDQNNYVLLKYKADINLSDKYGKTPLMIYTIKESPDMVSYLMAEGADVNAANNNGDTALILAQTREVIQILLNHSSININHQNRKGHTALTNACKKKNLNKMKLLLMNGANITGHSTLLLNFLNCMRERNNNVSSEDIMVIKIICESGTDVNSCNDLQESPLDIAIAMKSCELAEVLYQHGAKIPHKTLLSAVKTDDIRMIHLLTNYGAEIGKINEDGSLEYSGSCLQVALSCLNFSCASILLRHVSDNVVSTAISEAVVNSQIQILEFLLHNRPQIFIPKESLLKAAEIENVSIMNLLLKAGASINGIHDNKTSLMSALSADTMAYLIKNGADVNIKTNTTALINIFSFEFECKIKKKYAYLIDKSQTHDIITEMARVLINCGANLKDLDEKGHTALMKSMQQSFPLTTIRLLISHSININQCNNSGQSALHLAAYNGNLENVEFILRLGADVNLQDEDGLTPLHCAIKYPELVRLFLEKGADINKHDVLGNTPLLTAAKVNFLESSTEILINHGCDINLKNKTGQTALIVSCKFKSRPMFTSLLAANADVTVISSDNPPESALSIVLNKWFPDDASQNMALKLLEKGATVELVRPDVIHRLIALDNPELIQKLIMKGLPPSDINLKMRFMSWPALSISPLIVCLLIGNIPLAKFMMKNLFLTSSDIKIFSNHLALENIYLGNESRTFLRELCYQPLGLRLLSFIAVSSAVGSGIDRQERIKLLKLPNIFKEYLLFKKIDEERLPKTDNENIEFLQELTINQVKDQSDNFFVEDLYFEMFMNDDDNSSDSDDMFMNDDDNSSDSDDMFMINGDDSSDNDEILMSDNDNNDLSDDNDDIIMSDDENDNDVTDNDETFTSNDENDDGDLDIDEITSEDAMHLKV